MAKLKLELWQKKYVQDKPWAKLTVHQSENQRALENAYRTRVIFRKLE